MASEARSPDPPTASAGTAEPSSTGTGGLQFPQSPPHGAVRRGGTVYFPPGQGLERGAGIAGPAMATAPSSGSAVHNSWSQSPPRPTLGIPRWGSSAGGMVLYPSVAGVGREGDAVSMIAAQEVPLTGDPPGFSSTDTANKLPGAPSRTGTAIPVGTDILVIAVDVERSGPCLAAHATLSVGMAIVAVHPWHAPRRQTLLMKRLWPLMPSDTVFAQKTWAGFWASRVHTLQSFGVPNTCTLAEHQHAAAVDFRECVYAFRAAARERGIPCHLVSDNPAGDMVHLETWLHLALAPLQQMQYMHALAAAPHDRVDIVGEAGMFRLHIEQEQVGDTLALPLNFDQDGRWERVRCLRSMQEVSISMAAQDAQRYAPGLLPADVCQRALRMNHTGHRSLMQLLFDLPPDAPGMARDTHSPEEDAHETAHDYAVLLCIRAGAIGRRGWSPDYRAKELAAGTVMGTDGAAVSTPAPDASVGRAGGAAGGTQTPDTAGASPSTHSEKAASVCAKAASPVASSTP